jgi:hypothetical protein
MLRLFVIIGIFFIVFHFLYKWLKKKVDWIGREFADISLKDKKEKIKIEKEEFNEALKQEEKELKEKQKEIEKLKK